MNEQYVYALVGMLLLLTLTFTENAVTPCLVTQSQLVSSVACICKRYAYAKTTHLISSILYSVIPFPASFNFINNVYTTLYCSYCKNISCYTS